MKPEESFNEIKARIPESTNLVDALDIFISFFESTDIEGCEKEKDGDMLLFEWGGPYSWDSSYSITLTRQYSYEDEKGEYLGMQQLRMNYKYDPELINVESGNFWFDGKNIKNFRTMVLNSEIVQTAKLLNMKTIEFELGDV